MEREISSLLLQSNRTLGSRLVDKGLCRLKDIESANETFVKKVREGNITQASLLRILIYDKQLINEADYIDCLIEQQRLGAINLSSYAIDTQLSYIVDMDVMRATWTLPIDHIDNHYFLASAYYLSDVVQQYWTDKLDGSITWYAASLQDIEATLDQIDVAPKEGD